jgi:hypothetical protein
MFIAEISHDSVRGVDGMPRRHVIVVSLSEPRPQRYDQASGNRLGLRLAMNGGPARFVDLFVRSAPWRPAQ